MEGDPFLHDSWHRKAEEEKGETQEDRDVELYRRFLEDAKKHTTLAPIVEELKTAVGKYADSVVQHSYAKKGKLPAQEISSSDHHRRLVHNAPIDVVNHLSREYKRLSIDNRWRSAIIGESRQELGDWALVVARRVLNHD